MSFDTARIHKSARRVTRFLRRNSRRPSSEAVHDLRTGVRSLETTFSTLGLDSKKSVRRVLRILRDVRKRAGKVRDMDVLTAHALAIKQRGEQDCLVQLLEYLGAERRKYARKLRAEIERTDSRLRRDLKQNLTRVDKVLQEAENHPSDSAAMPATMAKAIRLSAELNSPPRLSRSNLHSYRLQVKELRDVLQLSDKTADEDFLKTLGEVKDAIGEWHDWEVLSSIATRLLDHGPSCKLMKHLRKTSKSRYEHALALANHMRSHYLKPRRLKHSGHGRTSTLSVPVLEATSAIAEN